MARSRTRPRVLAVVLAGGAGSRMAPLTDDRAKPSLPFAGSHRLVDFPLSNCRHSGITDVWVIEQHDPHSLLQHLAGGRPWDLDRTLGGFRILHPFATGDEEQFHEGNAHALHVHAPFIREHDPTHVLVTSADHVYRADYRDLLDAHLEAGAGLSALTVEVPDPSRYGVVDVREGRVERFWYKSDDAETSFALTEDLLYDTGVLLDALDAVAEEHGEEGLGDFGEHLLPKLVDDGCVQAVAFDGYWRDVGVVEAYWQAHMDLLGPEPVLELDDRDRPLLGRLAYRPAARLEPGASVQDAMVSPGAVVGGSVSRSVVGPGVRIEPGAVVSESVLMDDVVVGAGAHVERAIVADQAVVEAGAVVRGGDDLAVVESESTVSGTWSPPSS
jgi:glucose-1-phosphate adenylyltransferase